VFRHDHDGCVVRIADTPTAWSRRVLSSIACIRDSDVVYGSVIVVLWFPGRYFPDKGV
jgi:hypothetical protein